MEQLVEWIRSHTDSSARILFEDQLRLLEPTEAESLHWSPLLPLETGREFIGGLYHLAFLPHQKAAFGDWHLAGRHIRYWSPDQLHAFCERYNIGWVVTWSRANVLRQEEDRRLPLSTDVFAALPFCQPVATVPRLTERSDENLYSIFRVRRAPAYFVRGSGRVVESRYNRIELADLRPDRGELVLLYHWQDELRADPPLELSRFEDPDDPVGFIRIRTDSPVDRAVIRNSYGRVKTSR
jgi:hypothetical protein